MEKDEGMPAKIEGNCLKLRYWIKEIEECKKHYPMMGVGEPGYKLRLVPEIVWDGLEERGYEQGHCKFPEEIIFEVSNEIAKQLTHVFEKRRNIYVEIPLEFNALDGGIFYPINLKPQKEKKSQS